MWGREGVVKSVKSHKGSQGGRQTSKKGGWGETVSMARSATDGSLSRTSGKHLRTQIGFIFASKMTDLYRRAGVST
jgi:hypothetical protein